jgi:N-acyl-D-amino-acid deacylase
MTRPTLVTNGRLVDGSGAPWSRADLLLADGRVARIGSPGSIAAGPETDIVDAAGHVVCPGFIDLQSHSIVPFLTDRRAISKIAQGVTTEIMGEDWTPAPFGGRIATPFAPGLRRRVGEEFDAWVARARGWSRFGDWLDDLLARGVSVNAGSFIGGSTVREYARGHDMGPSNPAELATMRRVVDDAMADGAFGLATALIYPPGAYADTDELVALCEVVAARGGVHITHVRSEEDRLLPALDEAIAIARRTGVVTEIYHLKAAGRRNWGLMPQAIAKIDAARAEGLDIAANMYPYEAAGTGLTATLPPWAEEGGRLYERLADPAERARIAAAMRDPGHTVDWANFGNVAGPENVLVAAPGHPDTRRYMGWWLSDIAADMGVDWVDAALTLLAIEGANIFCFYRMMSEENLVLQLQQPWISVSSDAGGLNPEHARTVGLAHPRAYGTWPRVLGHFSRDLGALPLEDAVRKMTAGPAARIGLWDRGLLRPGLAADVVVFDPATIRDVATYTDPHRTAEGVRDVWVNGVRVLADAAHTGALPGQRVAHR